MEFGLVPLPRHYYHEDPGYGMAALMYHALQCRANEVSPSQPCCAALLSLCHLGSLFLYLRVTEWRLTAMLVRHTLTSYLHPRTSAALCSPQEMLQNGVGPSPSLSWLEAPTQRSSLFPIKQLAIMLSTHLLWANLAAFRLWSCEQPRDEKTDPESMFPPIRAFLLSQKEDHNT